MVNLKNNQNGLGAIEAILILVIVGMIAGVGWFTYSANKKTNSIYSAANQASNGSPKFSKVTKKNTTSIQAASNKTADAAGVRANTIATALLSYSKSNNSKALYASYIDSHVTDGQFTNAFQSAQDSGSGGLPIGDFSPIFCSQSPIPDGFKVLSATLNTDTATVFLDQVNSYDGTVPKITLQYVNNNWSIDKYECVTKPTG